MPRQSPLRRPRGTPTVALNVFVLPEVKERLDAVRERVLVNGAPLPLWAVVEAAVMAAELDPATGVPKGWDLPADGETSLPGINGRGGDAVRSDP